MSPRARAQEDGTHERASAERHARPSVTVDVVILTILAERLEVLLVRRGAPPFLGAWALPGGFVHVTGGPTGQGESLDDAARRELEEETGLEGARVFLEQLGAFGRPARDPRTRVITVAYYALLRPELARSVKAGSDAADARFVPVRDLDGEALAFDHREIVDAALARLARDLDRAPVAFELVPETFTIPELRRVYEILTGEALDPGNFNRRFRRLLEAGVVEQVPGKRVTTARPARVFRFRR